MCIVVVLDGVYECAIAGGTNCAGLSEIIQHISDENYRPNTLLMREVRPFYNRSEVVGYLIGGFNWDTILENSLSESVDDIYCVIRSPEHAYSFELSEGKSTLLGEGSRHDKDYAEYKKSITLSLTTDSTDSVVYTVDIYPTKQFYDKYHSDIPIIITVVGLLVVIAITVLFIIYDRLVKADSDSQAHILEQKRLFVRLVSHEIRTPLNTVKMVCSFG